MQFVIDNDIILRAGAEKDIFYYDYESCSLKDSKPDTWSVQFVNIPVTKVMREFIISLNDRQMLFRFRDIDDERLRSYFWVWFDDDGVNSSHWAEFRDKYYLDAVKKWCMDNGISYRTEI